MLTPVTVFKTVQVNAVIVLSVNQINSHKLVMCQLVQCVGKDADTVTMYVTPNALSYDAETEKFLSGCWKQPRSLLFNDIPILSEQSL